jgi:ABC-type transport system involved in cytochrome bd biosynthesis fused ATPase/permease subunit
MVRVLLYPLVAALRVSSTIFDGLSFMPELAVVLAGILASTLIGAAYLTPMVAVSKVKRKTSQNKNPAVEK